MRYPLPPFRRPVIDRCWGRCRWTKALNFIAIVVAVVALASFMVATAAIRILRVGCSHCNSLLLETPWGSDNLATKRAKSEGIEETAFTNFTSIGNAFAGPRLRSFVQEHDSSAVDNVSLDTRNVQNFLNLGNSDHIMVRRPANLNCTMVFVKVEAKRTESAVHTI